MYPAARVDPRDTLATGTSYAVVTDRKRITDSSEL